MIGAEAKDFSLWLRDSGTGIGTSTPDAALHIYSDGGASNGGNAPFENARVVVENDLPTTGFREMFALVNNGASRFTMENTANDVKWGFASDALGRFTFSVEESDGPEFAITPGGRVIMGPGSSQTFDLRPNGNLTIAGTLSQASDENLKTAFEEVDALKVLELVDQMPITTWQFKTDQPHIRHMGPTAQDFHAAFELGENDRTIAPVDGIGVSMVSIKALNQKIEDQSRIINSLLKRIEKLESDKAP